MTDKLPKHVLFFKLYNYVHPRVFSYLMIVVHNHADAEELLQETATVMWEKFDQFQEGTNFGAWAVSIARNKALEFLRKNRKTRMVFEDDFYDLVSKHAKDSSSDVTDRAEALRHCLNKLPGKDKRLLLMRYKKDISIKKISQLTGRSLNGLYQSFTRIIAVVRNCMQRCLARQEVY